MVLVVGLEGLSFQGCVGSRNPNSLMMGLQSSANCCMGSRHTRSSRFHCRPNYCPRMHATTCNLISTCVGCPTTSASPKSLAPDHHHSSSLHGQIFEACALALLAARAYGDLHAMQLHPECTSGDAAIHGMDFWNS